MPLERILFYMYIKLGDLYDHCHITVNGTLVCMRLIKDMRL